MVALSPYIRMAIVQPASGSFMNTVPGRLGTTVLTSYLTGTKVLPAFPDSSAFRACLDTLSPSFIPWGIARQAGVAQW